jgi:hypothetical protein
MVPDTEVESYLEAVLEAARELLGTEFVGAYAAGSLALDAFQPGRSDVDTALLCRDQPSDAAKRELIARLRHKALHWWMALPSQADDRPAAGADDAVLGACRALVPHRYGRWMSKFDAGRQLLAAGYRPVEMIEQSIAARSGGPPPSSRGARTFQEGVLKEILTAT